MLLANEILSIPEKLSLGSITAIIGILLVFVVLFLLIGIIYLLEYLVKCEPKATAAIKVFIRKITAPLKAALKRVFNRKAKTKLVMTETSNNLEVTKQVNEEELIACISGAISYIIATEQNVTVNNARARFIVKSIKRI